MFVAVLACVLLMHICVLLLLAWFAVSCLCPVATAVYRCILLFISVFGFAVVVHY